ncbi:MAG TPA: hypothetical protein PKY62_01560 [Actinotalea sp.]|nr:hypothetical protein [Actinotalea sp.]
MPVHQGDLVTVRGRPGVWRVARVRRGAVWVASVSLDVTATAVTVAVHDVEVWSPEE